MKYLLVALFFFIFSNQIFCQDSSKYNSSHHQFSFELGCHYSCFFGNTYIAPSISNFPWVNAAKSYAGYTEINTLSPQFGILYDYKYKNWILTSGLLYYNRKVIYESDSSKLAEVAIFYNNYYNSMFHTHNLPSMGNMVKLVYSPNNIEVPLFLGYKWNQIEFNIGVQVSLITYYNNTFTYLDGSKTSNTQSIQIFGANSDDINFSYGIRFGYHVQIKRILLIPYLSVNMVNYNNNNYVFEIGLKISPRAWNI